MLTKIYILLPVYNRKKITEQFIKCLCEQTFKNYHLLLIDDGSTDGTDEMVKNFIESFQLTIIKGNGDWWWAGCLQQGIIWLNEYASINSLVLFINDDVTFDDKFLETALTTIKYKSSTLLLAKIIDKNTGKINESGVNADLTKLRFKIADSNKKINCLSSRGLFLRLSDINKIGGFRPILLPHYWSDYEFTVRAYRKGFLLCTSNYLYLSMENDQTGFRHIDELNLFVFIRKIFSKKAVPNPIYRSIFILLTSPISNAPTLISKTWYQVALLVINQARLLFSLNFEKIKIKSYLLLNRGKLNIILGAGDIKYKNWISTDYPIVDVLKRSTLESYFKPSTVDSLLAEHVWEHLSEHDAFIAATNCFNLLKPGGYFRIAVPDGYHKDLEYIESVKPGGTGLGSDGHKVLFNYKSLSDLLSKSGFQVKLLEWFDEGGTFHYESWSENDGLIRRSTRFDARNISNPTQYTSLIIDAIKPLNIENSDSTTTS